MATTCHAREDDLFSTNLQKRYNGLVMVRKKAVTGKGAWYWYHLEPILFQNEDTGAAKAIKLRCGLCSALFSASNPSRTATEHFRRGSCPNFHNPEAAHSNDMRYEPRPYDQLALPAPVAPLAMITAPHFSEPPNTNQPRRAQLNQPQTETALNLLSEWFYESCGYISFSTLDHPKFKAFLNHLGIPNASRSDIFGAKLDAKYERVKFRSESKLQEAMFFQISTDGWRKEKHRSSSAHLNALANITLNLPNGSSLFHKVLFLETSNPSSDYIRDILWSTIVEISGSNVFRCAGIVADVGNVNSAVLRQLELQNHWMVNITCQFKAVHKLLQDFLSDLPLFGSTASICFKIAQKLKYHYFDGTSSSLSHQPYGSLDYSTAMILAVDNVAQLFSQSGHGLKERVISLDPSDRELSDTIEDSKFCENLKSVASLINFIKTSLQEIKEDQPCLGQCLPLWKELKVRIVCWCSNFNIDEKPVMELVNRRFEKNYHEAWAASYVLDPLYLVEDNCGRYLPPFKFLTSEQEKDVVKIIKRLTQNEEAHIALMELMKWRTEGLDSAYAQAVQAKERDPITGKMRLVNPRGNRLIWETYLSEFRVLRQVAARLIFLRATTRKLNCNHLFLSWVHSKNHSKETIERAQKVLFVSSHQRLEKEAFSDDEGKDAELFCSKDGKSCNQF
ncbi:uncharacterized protein LOC131157602 [Malania oleifera]|uniref:uncharacterized protein LOC131157602 n=1 Tax=Malania oleifera TaxID=397392 RepID=UPI0025AE3B21|nr:uncharacterized protein LOC131157602 [Malania oleifera]